MRPWVLLDPGRAAGLILGAMQAPGHEDNQPWKRLSGRQGQTGQGGSVAMEPEESGWPGSPGCPAV